MNFYQFRVTLSPLSSPGEIERTLTALAKAPPAVEAGGRELVRKHIAELLYAPIPYNIDRRGTLVAFMPEEGEPVQPPAAFEDNTPAMKIMPDGVKVWILKTPL